MPLFPVNSNLGLNLLDRKHCWLVEQSCFHALHLFPVNSNLGLNLLDRKHCWLVEQSCFHALHLCFNFCLQWDKGFQNDSKFFSWKTI